MISYRFAGSLYWRIVAFYVHVEIRFYRAYASGSDIHLFTK